MEIYDNNSSTGAGNLEEARDNIINASAGNEADSSRQLEANRSLGTIAYSNTEHSSGDSALLELGKESQVTIFETGIKAVAKHFGVEAAEHVRSDLARIDDIERRTIGALEGTDAMTDRVRSLVHTLDNRGINANNLTIAEAQAVEDYATNATEEIVHQKVNSIHGAIVHHIEGVHSRRDGAEPAFYNPKEIAKKERIGEKFVAWDRGEYDTEHGFDVEEVYARLVKEGCEPSDALKRHLEEEDPETLHDEGLIDESDLYVYGPFTAKDLDDIEVYTSTTWTSVTDPRHFGGRKRVKKTVTGPDGKLKHFTDGEVDLSGASLSSLIGRTIDRSHHNGLEDDLIHDFIAREIIQSRRLEAKDLLTTSTALALDFLESSDIKEAYSGDEKKEYNDTRRTVSWLAYYTGIILGYSTQELKDRFGSTRPIAKEFFDKAAEAIKNLSEKRSAYLDESFKPLLTKMDEHLHDLQDRMAAASSEQSDSLFSEDLD